MNCNVVDFTVRPQRLCMLLLNVFTLRFLMFQALIHGLNRHYYSITINYRKNELEQKV